MLTKHTQIMSQSKGFKGHAIARNSIIFMTTKNLDFTEKWSYKQLTNWKYKPENEKSTYWSF